MPSCLIVDPTPVVQKVASRILVGMNFDVESVDDRAQADAWLERNACPDMLIVGAEDETRDAETFISGVRERPQGRRVTIIAAITEAKLGLMTRLRRAGADDYLFLPFDRDGLVSLIERWSRKDRAA